MPKIKNIIIFLAIGVALVLVYIFFIKSSPEPGNLATTSNSAAIPDSTGTASDPNTAVGQEFLTLLLNVKNINLNDAIFTDPAFISLRDSSITLVQDGTEGRPNPFAPIGAEDIQTVPTPTDGTTPGTQAGGGTTN